MTAPGLFETVRTHFTEFLNCGLFTTDSIEGWICIFILCVLLFKFGQRAMSFVSWSIMVILLIQILHCLSLTSFSEILPISGLFHYDLLGNINNTIENGMIHDILEWFGNAINSIVSGTWDFIHEGRFEETLRRVLTFDVTGA